MKINKSLINDMVSQILKEEDEKKKLINIPDKEQRQANRAKRQADRADNRAERQANKAKRKAGGEETLDAQPDKEQPETPPQQKRPQKGQSSITQGAGSDSGSGEDTPKTRDYKPAEEASRSEKIDSIKSFIGDEESPGKWTSKTSSKWEEWIVSDDGVKKIGDLAQSKGITLKENTVLNRLALRRVLESMYLNEEDDTPGTNQDLETPDELKDYLEKNKGSAAKVAKDLGYSPSLDGVYTMVNDVQFEITPPPNEDDPNKDDPNKDDPNKDDPPEADNSWTSNRWGNKNQAKKVVNSLNSKYAEVYDSWPMMGRVDVHIGNAITKGFNCPGLHVGFVRSQKELGEDFLDYIQTGSYANIDTINNYGDEPINIYSASGADIDVGALGGGTDLYYDEATKELLIDGVGSDDIIRGIYLTSDKKYLYYDPQKYQQEYDDEGNRIKESVKEQNLRMLKILRKYNIV